TRAGDRAATAADGRTLRRARRDHPVQAQQRSSSGVAGRAQHRDLRYALGVRVGLPLAADRRADPASRPRFHRDSYSGAVSARRKLPHLGGIGGLVPSGGAGARGRNDRGDAVMNERALRTVLPFFVLALVVACWHAVVRIFAIPPFVLPGPGLVLATLIADGPLLWQSLLVTLRLTFEGFLLAAVGGIGLAVDFT